MERFNDMQTVKRSFFAMRNGVVADALRKGGSPFKIIFGVNLPQLVDIARETKERIGASCHSDGDEALLDLARQLWANTTTRESMLLAPMLVPHGLFPCEEAREWIRRVPAPEVADVLCHRLLRHQAYAPTLAAEFAESENEIERYTALRLMCNIARQNPDLARQLGEAEQKRSCPLTRSVAAQLMLLL